MCREVMVSEYSKPRRIVSLTKTCHVDERRDVWKRKRLLGILYIKLIRNMYILCIYNIHINIITCILYICKKNIYILYIYIYTTLYKLYIYIYTPRPGVPPEGLLCDQFFSVSLGFVQGLFRVCLRFISLGFMK